MIKSTPPLMPEVIYVCETVYKETKHVLAHETQDLDYATSYTRTDLCEELKAAVKDCSELLFTLRELIKRVPELNHNSYEALGTKVNTALTKAQGLLR